MAAHPDAGCPIRLVCFDIGGVLVQHCRSWVEGCEAAGVPVRHGTDCCELVQRRRHLSHLLTCGEIREPDFYREMAAATSGLYAPEEIERIHYHWLGREYEGIAEVVQHLIAADRVDTGILSNTSGTHWERLVSAAPECDYKAPQLPRHKHASHLLGMAKPSPDIYREFASRVGRKGPEILFFEDLSDNVEAAQMAGWQTVLIDHTGDTAAQVAGALRRRGLLDN
jgi:glucose-1-phosphatase